MWLKSIFALKQRTLAIIIKPTFDVLELNIILTLDITSVSTTLERVLFFGKSENLSLTHQTRIPLCYCRVCRISLTFTVCDICAKTCFICVSKGEQKRCLAHSRSVFIQNATAGNVREFNYLPVPTDLHSEWLIKVKEKPSINRRMVCISFCMWKICLGPGCLALLQVNWNLVSKYQGQHFQPCYPN